ncbi:hypothetical protein DSC45_07305 [Streptomyces sp. YIM 130001]|uniref:hypothetical protein n=1 Tax=Streptomyces sp. YIM 130001 TaxID=2259644 RepID=UPI000ECEA4D3|nr:hypothetical protein [Streptomyces sp. YIM 130001]RII19801.1 hypothetical protein DSC45_07305 [Streptomyces sp. YIM 130001]
MQGVQGVQGVRGAQADGAERVAALGRWVGAGAVSGVAPGAAAVTGALVSEFTSLRGLQSAVGELLRDLGESPACSAELGRERVARGQLGGGADAWVEAAGMHGACAALARELGSYARLLEASVEAVGATALAARHGYENVDGEVRSQVAAAGAELAAAGGAGADGGVGRHGR